MRLLAAARMGEQLRLQYDCTDPCRMCEEEGLVLLMQALGTGKNSLKGFIVRLCGRTAVVINSDLPSDLQRAVLYHEFAHYILHIRTGRMDSVSDSAVYDVASEEEYEADLLAAELQLQDEEVMETLTSVSDLYRAAESLRIPYELLILKLKIMKEKGRKMPEIPEINAASYICRFT